MVHTEKENVSLVKKDLVFPFLCRKLVLSVLHSRPYNYIVFIQSVASPSRPGGQAITFYFGRNLICIVE